MIIRYDDDGKIDLAEIYNRGDPAMYFAVLGMLDYCIPQYAKPTFRTLIDARRVFNRRQETRLVDVGCSYGVNAAMLKYDLSFDQLREHYEAIATHSREEMLRQDAFFFSSPADPQLEVIGMDTAHRALRYALDAGVMDGGTTANFETGDDVSSTHRRLLADADIVISTGCFGYVTSRTLDRILLCCQDNRPWMCHTVLRMFDFADAAAALSEQGYVTEKVDGLFRQRRFANPEEQRHVLGNLSKRGLDASGLEDDGWFYAETYVSRPAQDAHEMPLRQLTASFGPDASVH